MIPYYGAHGSWQRTNNKLIRVGFEIDVFAEAYGYLV